MEEKVLDMKEKVLKMYKDGYSRDEIAKKLFPEHVDPLLMVNRYLILNGIKPIIRVEELNTKDCNRIMELVDDIGKSGRYLLADRLHDFLLDNTMLIREEIP